MRAPQRLNFCLGRPSWVSTSQWLSACSHDHVQPVRLSRQRPDRLFGLSGSHTQSPSIGGWSVFPPGTLGLFRPEGFGFLAWPVGSLESTTFERSYSYVFGPSTKRMGSCCIHLPSEGL